MILPVYHAGAGNARKNTICLHFTILHLWQIPVSPLQKRHKNAIIYS
jgi:hypothetical protein